MLVFFFFRQRTSYVLRISDWSSDVCSSDLIGLAYATAANGTGKPIYARAEAQLHADAAAALQRAIALAAPLGLRFRIFDAFRPVEAQWRLWEVFPDPEFVADQIGRAHV